VAKRILKRGGYFVLEAPGVEQARRLCRERSEPIDVLLSDLVLPAMNGRELAVELLKLHPEMKVVFMSGYTETAATQQDFLTPGSSFIEKPFTPDGVLSKLREILARR
jgi:DNA-binding NtrC family response regulator